MLDKNFIAEKVIPKADNLITDSEIIQSKKLDSKAKLLEKTFERDLKEFQDVFFKFNLRYGKFIIGHTIIKANNEMGYLIDPMIDAGIYDPESGAIINEKSLIEQLIGEKL